MAQLCADGNIPVCLIVSQAQLDIHVGEDINKATTALHYACYGGVAEACFWSAIVFANKDMKTCTDFVRQTGNRNMVYDTSVSELPNEYMFLPGDGPYFTEPDDEYYAETCEKITVDDLYRPELAYDLAKHACHLADDYLAPNACAMSRLIKESLLDKPTTGDKKPDAKNTLKPPVVKATRVTADEKNNPCNGPALKVITTKPASSKSTTVFVCDVFDEDKFINDIAWANVMNSNQIIRNHCACHYKEQQYSSAGECTDAKRAPNVYLTRACVVEAYKALGKPVSPNTRDYIECDKNITLELSRCSNIYNKSCGPEIDAAVKQCTDKVNADRSRCTKDLSSDEIARVKQEYDTFMKNIANMKC